MIPEHLPLKAPCDIYIYINIHVCICICNICAEIGRSTIPGNLRNKRHVTYINIRSGAWAGSAPESSIS